MPDNPHVIDVIKTKPINASTPDELLREMARGTADELLVRLKRQNRYGTNTSPSVCVVVECNLNGEPYLLTFTGAFIRPCEIDTASGSLAGDIRAALGITARAAESEKEKDL